jgi:hypothetical protein
VKLCLDLPNSSSIIGQWLYDWQTLVSGFLALIAAGVTVIYLKKQISLSEKQETDRLQRQHNAARVTLPLTLSGLCQVIEQMLMELHTAKSDPNTFQLPAPPTNAIIELQQIILSTDNSSITTPIAEIIREIQTLWVRVEALSNRGNPPHSHILLISIFDEWIIQAAKIYALIESLFDYSRFEKQDGPKEVAWERVEAILMRMYVHDEKLRAMIERNHNNSPNFWSSQ